MDTSKDYMPLITYRQIKRQKSVRAIHKELKKQERKSRLFDFRTKLYKAAKLDNERLFDLTADQKQSIQTAPSENIDQFISRIENSNVIGMGGGFPAAEKLKSFMSHCKGSGILIINVAECEPGLLHDDWLIRNRQAEISYGINILSRHFKFEKIYLASKQNLDTSLFTTDSDIIAYQLDYFYPAGQEHILINQILGKQIDHNAIPAQYGILVFNVQTVIAIGKAEQGEIMSSRYLTAANLHTSRAVVVKASFGSNILKTSEAALGNKASYLKVYAGHGAMSAYKVESADIINAQTSFIAYAQAVSFADTSACIGCGTCQRKCPVHLPIAGLIKYAGFGQKIPEHITRECIACGACSYFCKAGIDTRKYILRGM